MQSEAYTEEHAGHIKLAWLAGYNDAKAQGEYKPHHAKCVCVACLRAYGKGSDEAIKQMIGKR
jgi:hypothetical protein